MSKKRILKLLLPSIALTFGSQVGAYTLQEAVSHTLATSPDLLIQLNIREEVDKQLRQSYAGYLPVVDLAAGWGQQYTNNSVTRAAAQQGALFDPLGVALGVGIESSSSAGTRTLERTEFNLIASQMLFDGFSVYHDVQGNKARVKAESWRVNASAQDVALNVVEAFIDVLMNRELVKLGRDNVAVHEQIYGQIEKRSESGIGRKADLDQALARLALSRTNMMASEGQLIDSETAFLRQVGIKTPAHLEKPEAPRCFPQTERDAVELGLQRHPTLIASVEDWVVTREEHKGARAPFQPRVDLVLSMDRNHNVDGNLGDSDQNMAILRMQWNLFRGGRDLARICETAYKMQEAQEVHNRAFRQVVQAVRFAWNLYDTNRRELPYFKQHVDAGARTLDAYQKQFNIGQRTLLDLLDSQNELYGAKTAYIKGQYDELRGRFRVLNATGTLTETLCIALPKHATTPRPDAVMDGSMRFFDKSSTLFDS